jgi:nucleolar protein 4
MQATEAHIRAALQQAGFVWELTLPRDQDGKLRGFAFGAFMMRAHAEKAIKIVNGTVSV